MRRFLVASLLASLALSPALARDLPPIPKGAQIMQCDFDFPHTSAILPDRVVVVKLPGGEVQVIDPVGNYYHKAPTPAVTEVDNARRSTWTWSFGPIGGGSSGADYVRAVNFRLTLVKASRGATVMVYPSGYLEENTSGRCSDWKQR